MCSRAGDRRNDGDFSPRPERGGRPFEEWRKNVTGTCGGRTGGTRRILVLGAGELATAVGWHLARAGVAVLHTEIARPLAVRRMVSFCEAVHEGRWTVEGVAAVLLGSPREAAAWMRGHDPAQASSPCVGVVVDPGAEVMELLRFDAVVDARMMKRNDGTILRAGEGVLSIALGPGFIAGSGPERVDFVIETHREAGAGRIIASGSAMEDTGTPSPVLGHAADRVLRAPADGIFEPIVRIGDLVEEGRVLAQVNGVRLRAPFAGMIRGMLRSGTRVERGMKCGDVDPRGEEAPAPTAISDKGHAVGAAVVSLVTDDERRWNRR